MARLTGCGRNDDPILEHTFDEQGSLPFPPVRLPERRCRSGEVAPILAALIPGLETAVRTADSEQVQAEARELLGDTYQAIAALMVKIGETDAAWIAADRAGFCAEAAGSPPAVAARMFRMAHVFLALGQIDQAHHVATSTAVALQPKVTSDARPEVLSLYGASHLIVAVAAARDNKRSEAHDYLDTARKIAEQHPGSSTTVDGTHRRASRSMAARARRWAAAKRTVAVP